MFLIWFADLDRPSRWVKKDAARDRPSRDHIDMQLINSLRGEMYSLSAAKNDIDQQNQKIAEIHRKADVSRILLTIILTLIVTVTVALLPAFGVLDDWAELFETEEKSSAAAPNPGGKVSPRAATP